MAYRVGSRYIISSNLDELTIQELSPCIGFDGSSLWNVLGIDTNGNIQNKNLVWDVDTLTWVSEVGNEATSSSVTSVDGLDTSVMLLAANTGRKLAIFYNDSSELLYLKLGDTASATSFTVLIQANSFWVLPLPVYTGRIDGIWSGAVGSCRITELS